MATDQAHDSIPPPDAALRQSRSSRRSPSRVTWVALLLSLTAILAALCWPAFRRWQAIKSLEKNGAEVGFTDESEWITEWFGEAGNGLRDVLVLVSDSGPGNSLRGIGLFAEARAFIWVTPRGITREDIEEFRLLDDLVELRLEGSEFTDKVVADIFQDPANLERVWLRHTGASQSALQAVTRVSSIRRFYIIGRDLDDAAFAKSSALPNLQEFSVFESKVGDAAMAWVAQSKDLRILEVYQSRVTDDGLAKLAQLTELRKLWLIYCPAVTDAGIVHLEGLPNLNELFVDAHCVTPEFIESLRRMPSLRSLEVAGVIADPALRETLVREWHLEIEVPPASL